MSGHGAFPTVAEMRTMNYRQELVPLAKQYHVRANMKKEDMIDALVKEFRKQQYRQADQDYSEYSTTSTNSSQSDDDTETTATPTIDVLKQMNWNELRATAKAHHVKATGRKESILAELVDALCLRDKPQKPAALVTEPEHSGFITRQNYSFTFDSTYNDDNDNTASFDSTREAETEAPKAAPPSNELRSPNFYKKLNNYAELQHHAKIHGIKARMKKEDIRSALIEKAVAVKGKKSFFDANVNIFIDMNPEAPSPSDISSDLKSTLNAIPSLSFEDSTDLFESTLKSHPVRGQHQNDATAPLSFDSTDESDAVFKREPPSFRHPVTPATSSPVQSSCETSRFTTSRPCSIAEYFENVDVSSILEPAQSAPTASSPLPPDATFTVCPGVVKHEDISGWSNVSFAKSTPTATTTVPLDFDTPKRRPRQLEPVSSPFRSPGRSQVTPPRRKRLDELSTPKKITPRYVPKQDNRPRWK